MPPLSPCEGGRAFQVQALKTAVMAFPACEGKSLLNISGISQDNSFPRVRGEEPPPPKRKQHYRRLSPCAGGEERSPNFYGRAPQFFRIREGKSGPSARSRFHTDFLQGAQSFCRVMLFLLALLEFVVVSSPQCGEKYSLFLRFSSWRNTGLRHFVGYPCGTSRKKASTIFYNTALKNTYFFNAYSVTPCSMHAKALWAWMDS